LQLADVIRSVRRHWRVSVAMLLLVGALLAAVLYSLDGQQSDELWEARTAVLLPARDAQGERPEGVPPALLEGIVPVAVSGEVTADALERAGLSESDRGDVTFDASTNEDRDILTLRVEAPSEDTSVALASAYADAFIAQRQATVAATAESGRTSSLASLEALEARLDQVETELRAIDPDLLAIAVPTRGPEGELGPPDVSGLPRSTSLETTLLVVERANLVGRISQTQQAYAVSSTETLVPQAFATIVERTVPDEITPEGINPLIPVAAALVLGLVLAVGVPVLMDRADRSIRDERAASSALSAPVMARIPAVGRRALSSVAAPGSARATAYQALAATSIATDQLPRAIVVTAPTGEIQDSVAANFAAGLAGMGLSVALVGTDPRQEWFVDGARPDQAVSLPDLLMASNAGRLNGSLQESLVPTHLDNLKVVAPGAPGPELLLDGLPGLLQSLAEAGVDVTVVAGPAFLEDPTATILAWSTRSVLWAVESGAVTSREAHEAASRLELAGGASFGIALVEGRD